MSGRSLYAQVLGADFERLPPLVRRFHALSGHTQLQGWVTVAAPAGFWARGLAWCLGAPQQAASGALRFELAASPTAETWIRHFPGRVMRSDMRVVNGQLQEQLGAVRLTFELQATPAQLSMQLVKLRCLGLPCPRWLMPQVRAVETEAQGRFQFEVHAALPWVGTVASYRGHLDLNPEDAR
jgi:hypothetical protein